MEGRQKDRTYVQRYTTRIHPADTATKRAAARSEEKQMQGGSERGINTKQTEHGRRRRRNNGKMSSKAVVRQKGRLGKGKENDPKGRKNE